MTWYFEALICINGLALFLVLISLGTLINTKKEEINQRINQR